MKKRIISIILAVVMITGMIPLGALSALAESTGKYIERSWNETTKTVEENEQDIPTDAIEFTSSTTSLDEGKWYVLSEDVTVSGKITVNGTANIILLDGCTLIANAGIIVNENNALNIYGQAKNTGTLNITGGIENSLGCALTIHGGIVNATGNEYSAGIGGLSAQIGGTVTIYGGTVNATGGEGGGAGIGGGYWGNGGDVKIYGGAVTALGGSSNAEGIGKGKSGSESGKLEMGDSAVIKAGTDKDNATDASYNGQPYVNIHWHNFTDGVCTICCETLVITIPAEEATCTKNGHIEYHQKDGNYYSDKDCTVKIADLEIWLNTPKENGGGMIPAKGHTWHWFSDYEHYCTVCYEQEDHTVDDDYICTGCRQRVVHLAKEDAIKAINDAAGDSQSKAVKTLIAAAIADINDAATVKGVQTLTAEWIAEIETLTGGGHTHTFADRYTYDENHHWYACTCDNPECNGLVSGFGMHNFNGGEKVGIDTVYTCTDCGYQKTEHGTPDIDTFTVTFNLQQYEGTVDSIEPIYVAKGGKIETPTIPDGISSIFGGWFTEPGCFYEWNFENNTVNADTTLYAKWIPASCSLYLYWSDDEGTRTCITARYGQLLNNITPRTRNGLVFRGFYDINGIQYIDSDGKGIKIWDKETHSEMLVAYWTVDDGGIHMHKFASKWSFDENHHWHECACENAECGGFVSDFGEHTFDDGVPDGIVTIYTCRDCGYQKIVLSCDINSDGKVDATDLALLKIAVLSGCDCDYFGELDCNGDGKFDIRDIVRLKKVLANANTPLQKQESEQQTEQPVNMVANVHDKKEIA